MAKLFAQMVRDEAVISSAPVSLTMKGTCHACHYLGVINCPAVTDEASAQVAADMAAARAKALIELLTCGYVNATVDTLQSTVSTLQYGLDGKPL